MNKFNKRDFINLISLTILFLGIVLLLTRFKYIYGSTTDWQQQHWLFPEYFRTLFYSTHDLLPSFAFNLGGGQNIFNFSYYGLLSPVVLFSYFFPFLKMMDYMILASILTVISSVWLLYKWLKNNGFESSICFISSLVFLCSGPLIFQSHRHIMFIDYFPFLIMGLMGVDRFFNKKKSSLLIISVFLMILTSYYYSVAGIFVLIIYAIYKTPKFKELLKIIIPVILGVFLAGILLLPTFMALLNGRSNNSSESYLLNLSLIIPDISLNNFFYNPYSLGVMAITLIAIIWGFFSENRKNLVLSFIMIIIMVFPLFLYLLNGTLYIRGKVLIPFIPIMSVIISNFLRDIIQKKIKTKWLLLPLVVLILTGYLSKNLDFRLIILLDTVICFVGIILYNKFHKKLLLFAPIALISISFCIVLNLSDKLVETDEQTKISQGTDSLVKNILENDKEFYRFSNEVSSLNNVNKVFASEYYQATLYSSIFNQDYKEFCSEIFNNEQSYRNVLNTATTKNVLFNIYMGNKYLITDTIPQIGYDLVSTKGSASIYKNENVFPLGYVTNQIIGEAEFDNLEYPYKAEALLKYCVAAESNTNIANSNIEPLSLSELSLINYKNLTIKNTSGTYNIQAKENAVINFKLNTKLDQKILFIRFNMCCQSESEDTYIIINGVKNKLTSKTGYYPNNNYTFDYVLSSNETMENLKVELRAGDYFINGIELHTLDYENIKNLNQTIDPFILDTDKTSGDVITGNINCTKDGMFVLNIPYDQGFTIKVNDLTTNYQKVNKAFIGFPITKGEKEIIITYEAPFKNTGIVLSLLGIVFTIVYILFENNKRRVSHEK